MSTSRVNSAFELVSAIRQSNLSAIKRALETKTVADVDDRRKLSIVSSANTNNSLTRRYFTTSEIQELASVLQELATSNAELGTALAYAAQEYVPPDQRGFGFWDYFAINLYKCERNADGYLIWNRAVTAIDSDSKSTNKPDSEPKSHKSDLDSKSHKSDSDSKSNKSDSDSKSNKSDSDSKSHKSDSDSKSHKSDSDSKSIESELPLRPRFRQSQTKSSVESSGVDELPVRPQIRAKRMSHDGGKNHNEKSESDDKKEVTGELPVRPHVRNKRGGNDDDDDKPDATGELPVRARVRGGKRLLDAKLAEAAEKKKAEDASEKIVETFCKAGHGDLGHIRNNMSFALQKLKCGPLVEALPTADKLFGVLHRTSWSSSSIPARYHAFNPSIITHPTDPGKFLVNLRAGNYFMNQHHRYEFPPGMSGITTLNFIGSLDCDFRGSDCGEMRQIKAPPMPNPYPEISGLEDIRLLWEPQSRKLYASFTSLEVTPEHRPQVCLMQLQPRKGRIVGNPVRLHGFDSDKTQKNWIGFADGGKLFFIHSLQPITVVQANPKTGEVRIVSVDATPVLNEWRGSSPLVELTDDLHALLPFAKPYSTKDRELDRLKGVRWFVALVHVSHFPKYHHQFIVMRKTPSTHSDFRPFSMAITHQSPPFVFEKHDVEFSCGMAFTPDHAEIVIPYSKRDNDCTCIRIATPSLLQQNMFPIPELQDFKL